ncbi:acetyl-CoA carboxylase biotin carboxyl carrier protein [uncultured Campylobacter sp.]|uniref:acetyl-CoA carboxylase biotin carboxyl carrier protein n=1 Tax=uncultured Campylobacter sp. TaxID=218934 RepID=UPI00261BC7ED|nr:acetyl-CoA carboxylase biotin carboxyl carrier protein [uncultured Campylobacter sp.]
MKKEEIKELMQFFEEIGIARMKIREGDFQIELEKEIESSLPKKCPSVQTQPAPQPQTQTVEIVTRDASNKSKESIKSPMVGTFYVAPAPGEAPFVKVGDKVKKGDIVGIIEAMKIMNEIEAEFDCKIVESLVEDGQPVEFGMGLFGVEKL